MHRPLQGLNGVVVSSVPNSLPPRLRDVAAGLYLQMYYWGRDVRHAEGNLLVEYGFRKIPKEGIHGTSRYQMMWQDGVVELHGHLAGWYRPDGESVIFVRQRHACQLCAEVTPVAAGRVEEARIWSPRHRAEQEMLAARLGGLLEWLLDYEHWVAWKCGPGYRRSQYREYQMLPKKQWWLPPAEALAWYESFVSAPASVTRPRKWAGDPAEAGRRAS
jgi:hypothetical protein